MSGKGYSVGGCNNGKRQVTEKCSECQNGFQEGYGLCQDCNGEGVRQYFVKCTEKECQSAYCTKK